MGREVSGVAQVLEREVPGLLLPELRWGCEGVRRRALLLLSFLFFFSSESSLRVTMEAEVLLG